MFGHAKSQAVILRCFTKQANDVFLRPHLNGVPTRVLSIPETKVVMMHAHADEVSSACVFVETNEIVRIKFVCFPGLDYILETELGGVPIRLHMMFVLPLSFEIHAARVPVAILSR